MANIYNRVRHSKAETTMTRQSQLKIMFVGNFSFLLQQGKERNFSFSDQLIFKYLELCTLVGCIRPKSSS